MFLHYFFKNINKFRLFKKTSKYFAILTYCILLSDGFAVEEEKLEGDAVVASHFKADASIICEALEGIETAELHFFWTTGREPAAMKSEFGANLNVDIGGSRFGSQFPTFLGFLLQYSPAKLTVKLTCDEMTRKSNKGWLAVLSQQYVSRFQIMDIYSVRDNLIKALPSQEKKIRAIFQNATCGNPAIASDIDRLIALVYGSNPAPENVVNAQFTYCDVDTFCFAMARPNQRFGMCFVDGNLQMGWKELNGHTNFMNALFRPMQMKQEDPIKDSHRELFFSKTTLTSKTPFYIGRKDDGGTGSSLIKLRIRDISAYNGFCIAVLEKVSTEKELNLVNYFSTLHGYVSRGIEDSEKEFLSYLEKFSSSLINPKDIMYVTGPGLIDQLRNRGSPCFPLDQDYPDTNAMEWHRTHYLEGGEGPLEELGRVGYELKSRVEPLFTQYARRLSDAFYVLRFGAKHPFVVRFLSHLRDQFPYATPSFKAIMAQLHEEQCKAVSTPIEEWLTDKFSQLTAGLKLLEGTTDPDLVHAPYYVRLNHVLGLIGVDRSLTRDDIDFRIL